MSDSRSYNYADRELVLTSVDLLQSKTDVIVCPNDSRLSSTTGLAQSIYLRGGEQLYLESNQLMREYGELLFGMAMSTSAGDLPYKAVIHAISPVMGCGDESRLVEQAVSNSLLLCEANHWISIAFPALGIGGGKLPVDLSARAMVRAIIRFWDARMDSMIERVELHVRSHYLSEFTRSIDKENAGPLAAGDHKTTHNPLAAHTADEPPMGEIELDDEDIAGLDNDDISEWFK